MLLALLYEKKKHTHKTSFNNKTWLGFNNTPQRNMLPSQGDTVPMPVCTNIFVMENAVMCFLTGNPLAVYQKKFEKVYIQNKSSPCFLKESGTMTTV